MFVHYHEILRIMNHETLSSILLSQYINMNGGLTRKASFRYNVANAFLSIFFALLIRI